nr:phosphomannomutase/phosphoglucomutase [Longispora sp. (in: high G+C Gram-positive bacteria)]
ERYVASGEINSKVDDTAAKIKQLAGEFEKYDQDTLDGLTVTFDDGAWLNVRPSNTEPLLRLNVEASTPERMAQVRDEALAIIRG